MASLGCAPVFARHYNAWALFDDRSVTSSPWAGLQRFGSTTRFP
ncbi:MAG TPA: hypothetical protein PLI08_02060 [Bacteroidia bacterium]|nr:hypothetical protein [Bacteroidia bacterium]HRI42108.1 hypothetical protein [Bacteroidia bacterium]HRS39622.1 hypothetical protein [Bacteroidia bacterium]HRU60011.1 hypothetical protein [Bacteroidia bacterium]